MIYMKYVLLYSTPMNVQAAFCWKVRLLLKCSYRMSICGQKEPPVGHPVVHPPNKAHVSMLYAKLTYLLVNFRPQLGADSNVW